MINRGYLVERIVVFARVLRENGIPCTIAEAIDAARTALEVGTEDLGVLKSALRAALVKDKRYYRLYSELFDRFWSEGPVALPRPPRGAIRVVIEGDPKDPVSRFLSVYSPMEIVWEELEIPKEGDVNTRRTLYRGLREYRRRLALMEGRRRRRSIRGDIDFRRTMKESLRTFGEIIKLSKSARKKSKSRLLLLIDVSNSMKEYWAWIQGVIAALRGLPAGSYEVFLFSTKLVRVTDLIESIRDQEELVEAIAREEGLWGSGTRIGEALNKLLEEYPSYLDRKSGVLIVSDGWDLGDLTLLEESLAELKRRVGYIAWITPYASSEGFKPVTACLRIAVNYVDDLLPTTILGDPRRLSRLIKRSINDLGIA